MFGGIRTCKPYQAFGKSWHRVVFEQLGVITTGSVVSHCYDY